MDENDEEDEGVRISEVKNVFIWSSEFNYVFLYNKIHDLEIYGVKDYELLTDLDNELYLRVYI